MPTRVQLAQRDAGRRVFGEQRALGDLKLQPRGRNTVLVQRADDVEHETGLLQLQRRKIHRNADLARPVGRGRARFVQRPVAERADHAHLLGDRDEVGGRHRAAQRMLPAQQRFGAPTISPVSSATIGW